MWLYGLDDFETLAELEVKTIANYEDKDITVFIPNEDGGFDENLTRTISPGSWIDITMVRRTVTSNGTTQWPPVFLNHPWIFSMESVDAVPTLELKVEMCTE